MENNLNTPQKGRKYEVGLIVVSCAIIFGFVIFMSIKPDSTLEAVNGLFDTLIKYMGGFIETFTFAAVVISLFFCISSKYGSVKLGNEEPEYNLFSYIAMMFLACVASAIIYWSFTEWCYYYESPGIGLEPESTAALEAGLAYSFFHWGLSGQAIYVVIALAIAYAYYIRKVPSLQTSAVCQAMMGEKIGDGARKATGKVVDFLVIFGIMGGLGVSLGLAVPLAGGALTALFGIEITFPMKVGIVLVIACIFTFTSFIGTKKGMQRLSNFSVACAGVMILWIFLLGPTDFIIKNVANSFGWMMEIFPRASFFTDPIESKGFPEGWTIFFQAFYLNYAAMMGIFITKISRGRTIRCMALCTLFGISAGGWTIFAIDSSFSIWTHVNGLTDVVALVNSGVGEAGIYQVLGVLPGGAMILPALVLLIIVGFVATSLDSASLSLSQTTQKITDKHGNVSRALRVFWCIVLTLIPLSIMFAEAPFETLKIMAIIISMPFMIVVAFMGVRTLMWLKEDDKKGLLDKYRASDKKETFTGDLDDPCGYQQTMEGGRDLTEDYLAVKDEE
ncbi:MAG: BCCT family transporter [Lentihominibacter sp.]|jgi:BCCT family betaine/carnitine transporter